MTQKPKIIAVNYGVASRYDNLIEINRKLKNPLRARILKHELSHKNGKYTKEDYKVDFQSKDPYFWQSIWFCVKNPEGWINFMPIMWSYYQKTLTFNTTVIFPLVLYGLVFGVFASSLFGVSLWLSLLAYFNIICVLNVFLLVYTHFYVWITAKH